MLLLLCSNSSLLKAAVLRLKVVLVGQCLLTKDGLRVAGRHCQAAPKHFASGVYGSTRLF